MPMWVVFDKTLALDVSTAAMPPSNATMLPAASDFDAGKSMRPISQARRSTGHQPSATGPTHADPLATDAGAGVYTRKPGIPGKVAASKQTSIASGCTNFAAMAAMPPADHGRVDASQPETMYKTGASQTDGRPAQVQPDAVGPEAGLSEPTSAHGADPMLPLVQPDDAAGDEPDVNDMMTRLQKRRSRAAEVAADVRIRRKSVMDFCNCWTRKRSDED